MTDLTLMGDSPFDAIRRTDEHGEYWSARDLMPLLGYTKWERFEDSVDRARISMANAGNDPERNASRLREPSGKTERVNYRLSRYGAYVVAMNGDVRKQEIADAQAYFAAKTHEAESRPKTTVVVSEISRRELAAMVIAEADRADAAEQRARELEPAAQSWNTLAEATGDYSLREAAQILDRDPSIRTGQNRLSKYLKNIGWTDHSGQPYQRHVDAGRLARRTVPYLNRSTGEQELTTQLRITAKGLADLHREMGGTGPLMTVVA